MPSDERMKVWLIRRMESCGWDEYDAKVIKARTEAEVRRLAALNTGAEGSAAWTEPGRSLVTEVHLDDPHEEVVLESFNAG